MPTDRKFRILVLNRQNSAVGYYRSWLPARTLTALGHSVTCLTPNGTYVRGMKYDTEAWFKRNLGRFDFILVDRCVDWNELGQFAGFRHFSPDCRMITDFDDDFTAVPTWNQGYSNYQPGQTFRDCSLAHLTLSELVTVSTPALSRVFSDRCHSIRVVPNTIDPSDWADLPIDPQRRADPAVRILYGGAGNHYGDLDAVRGSLSRFLEDPPCPIRLFCIGTIPAWMHDLSRRHPGRVFVLPWADFRDYPAVVAWGGFDISIAPLANHPFNSSKSNIKWLEATTQRIAFVGSNVGPYAELPTGTALRLGPDDWYDGLEAACRDADYRASLVSTASEHLPSYLINAPTTLDLWHNLLEDACSLPRITELSQTVLAPSPA